jgi:hypothetical protein
MVNYRYEVQVDVGDGWMVVGSVCSGAGRIYTSPVDTAYPFFFL